MYCEWTGFGKTAVSKNWYQAYRNSIVIELHIIVCRHCENWHGNFKIVIFIQSVIKEQGKRYRLRRGLRTLNYSNVFARPVHRFQANRPYLRFWANWSCFRNIIICRGDSPLARINSPRMFPLKPRRAALVTVIKRRKTAVRIILKFIVVSKVFCYKLFRNEIWFLIQIFHFGCFISEFLWPKVWKIVLAHEIAELLETIISIELSIYDTLCSQNFSTSFMCLGYLSNTRNSCHTHHPWKYARIYVRFSAHATYTFIQRPIQFYLKFFRPSIRGLNCGSLYLDPCIWKLF